MSKTDILHLTASPCFGGVERQMLELGRSLQESYRSAFATFQEEGRCWDFVERARQEDVKVHALQHDFPRVAATYRELLALVRNLQPRLLFCHGYKSNFFGLLIARRMRIPIVSVSHGWTGESRQVRLFEALDRRLQRFMDHVVCVSNSQAERVRVAGVLPQKITVIRNAIRQERFADVQPVYAERLRQLFCVPPRKIVGAAGRLSPEKGFDVLVDAAANLIRRDPQIGFVLFGEGRLRASLSLRIQELGLTDRFILAGFHSDLDKYFPHLDLFVLPSYTEGLPNVILEAFAAGVPVVASDVGGTSEIFEEGQGGYLVAPGNTEQLGARILDVLISEPRRLAMGQDGRRRVLDTFTFQSKAAAYRSLLDGLIAKNIIRHEQHAASSVGTHA